jgi:hypothetical protein
MPAPHDSSAASAIIIIEDMVHFIAPLPRE